MKAKVGGRCGDCYGTGWVHLAGRPGEPRTVSHPCSACSGTGQRGGAWVMPAPAKAPRTKMCPCCYGRGVDCEALGEGAQVYGFREFTCPECEGRGRVVA